MAYGVTPEGFVLKRLADIKEEWEDGLKGIFGETIDLAPNGPFGQLVGICSERESLIWELFEATYQAGFPRWASGIALDGVASMNGVTRQIGTKSTATFRAYGTEGTVIPALSVISVLGNSASKFKTDEEIEIGAGINAKQKLLFDGTPIGGSFTLLFDGESTASIPYNVNAAGLKAILENLDGIDEVTVTGTVSLDFEIEFTGDDGEKPQSLFEIGANTLSTDNIAIGDVEPSIEEMVAGSLPYADGTATASAVGATVSLAGSLSVIETTVSGWDSVTNLVDAEVGLAQEIDSELKIRREQQLSKAGAGTVDAIRARLLDIETVTAVTVYQNVEDTVVDGRPPHSIAALVEGGTDAEVAAALFKSVGGGIKTFGDVTVIHVDSQGFDQEIQFSRPTLTNIWLEADIDVTSAWPVNGEDLLLGALLAYGAAMSVGDDVIVYPKLIRVFDNTNFPGIVDITIRIGTAASPTLDDNIVIDLTERADWDSSRITINVTEVGGD